MMREFLRLFMLPLTILLAVSCNRTLEPDSSFIGSSAIELISSGQDTVTCSAIPSSTGQKLEATVTWSSGSSTQSAKGKFEVVKAQGDTFWLWCGDKKTPVGVTVRILK